MIIGGRRFENYTYVMAIINLTPDSFYKDSRATCDDVLFRAERAIKDGASVLDIGAQSTRPGYTEISAAEEADRLSEPLYKLKKSFDVALSVDTYFPYCARLALEAGADMINDVKGLEYDGMAQTVGKAGASLCIMHSRPLPNGDMFESITNYLSSRANAAVEAGVSPDRICVDGGIGFNKNIKESLALLNGYARLSSAGYPLLLGASRKSLFGGRPEDRLAATLQSTRLAVRSGVLFVRVHDVKENYEVIRREYGQY